MSLHIFIFMNGHVHALVTASRLGVHYATLSGVTSISTLVDIACSRQSEEHSILIE